MVKKKKKISYTHPEQQITLQKAAFGSRVLLVHFWNRFRSMRSIGLVLVESRPLNFKI